MPTESSNPEPAEQESAPVVPTVPKHVFDELLAAAARVNQHYLGQRQPNS